MSPVAADPAIRLLIADDDELVRTGFRLILEAEPDITVVAEATSGRAAVALALDHAPDVVLMDIRMPGLDGIQATRELCARPTNPPIRVLMLTTFDLDEFVYDALRAGASGFLLKDVAASTLADGIRTVAAGESLLAPTITRRLIEAFATQPALRTPSRFDDLTQREREIFHLVAAGHSNGEIAAELVISLATVKTHVARILTKLGFRDRIQIAILAYESGLITPGRANDPPTATH
jgi:DNA-binding NarL/FixJ family response regulator